MKRTQNPRRKPLKSKLALCGAAVIAMTCGAMAQQAKPAPPLTDGDLLRQIESFSPKSGDPLTKVPASIAETPTGAAALNETVAATADPKAKKPVEATEIKADGVEFDQKAHQAVFTGRVVVKHPEFDLTSDKLTAYLKNEKTPPPPGAPATPAPKGVNAPKKKSGGLDRAVAEGNVVITQDKLDTDGKPTRSVGRAARADYSVATGEIVLSGNPEVQQGINTCVATDPGTKMYMKRDGKMRVDGPSTMIIRDQGETK